MYGYSSSLHYSSQSGMSTQHDGRMDNDEDVVMRQQRGREIALMDEPSKVQ